MPGEVVPDTKARMINVFMAEAVYVVYRESLAVVYSGLERAVPTEVMPGNIIGLIASKEGLTANLYSWFDMQTVRQNGSLQPGEFNYSVIFLRPHSEQVEVECMVKLPDPPIAVLSDFAPYINGLAHDHRLKRSRDGGPTGPAKAQ